MAYHNVLFMILAVISFAQPSPLQNADLIRKNSPKRVNIAEALELPPITDLLANPGNIAAFQIGDCVLDFSKSDCEFTLQPSPEGCPKGLSLRKIMNHFFPGNRIKKRSKKFVDPRKFEVEYIKIDKCKAGIAFSCQTTESLEIIKKRFSIDEAKVAIEFNFRSGNVAWQKLGLDISGKATIGRRQVEVSLEKKVEDDEINFQTSVDQLSVSDFRQLFTKAKPDDKDDAEGDFEEDDLTDEESDDDLDDLGGANIHKNGTLTNSFSKLHKCFKRVAKRRSDVEEEGESASTEELTELVIEKPTLSGKIVPKESFEFLLTGLPKSADFTGTVFAIVKKEKKKRVQVGVVATIENFSPAALLSKLTKKDLSNIPLLKDITLNFAASVANVEISEIENEELSNAMKAFGDETDTIPKGLVLKIELPIKDVIEKMNPDAGDDVPDSLYIQVTVGGGKVNVDFPETWKTDLLKILSALTPNAIELLPDWLRGEGPGKIDIKELSYDFNDKVFNLHVTAEGPIEIQNIFSLTNVNIEVTHDYKQKKWDFKFESTQKLFDDVTLEISVEKEDKTFKVAGSIDEITTSKIARWLKAKFVSDSLMQTYRFLDFGVQDLKVEAEFGDGDLSFRITGTAIIGDWRGMSLEAILIRKEGENLLAVGVLFSKVRLDEILAKLFNKNIQFISWIGELDLAMAVSTTNSADQAFSLEGLTDMSIKRGFQFRAEFRAPSECDDDFCKQAQKIMGDNKIVLTGLVTTGSFEFSAAVQGNWKIGNNVVIQDIKLVIEISSDAKIFFSVSVKINRPNLELEGSIGIGMKGNVELSAKMKGMWEKPFGLQYVSIGDIFLTVGIYVGVMLPTVELGGRIVVGKIGNGKEIKAEGAIGLDPVTPTKNYFYAKVNQLTLGKIAEAFELSTNMPRFVTDTGFPEGLVVSFTLNPQGKMIETLNVEIPTGFAFKGVIQIDTYRVKCDITLNPPSFFDINVDMDPLTLAGGALTLYRSSTNKNRGPIVKAKVTTDEVNVHIAGYIYVLGIETEVDITVTNEKFSFHIAGKIFNIIQATIDVEASYGSLSDLEFQAKACIGTEVMDDIKKEFEKVKKEQTGSLRSVRRDAKTLLREVMALQRSVKKSATQRRQEMQRCYVEFENRTGVAGQQGMEGNMDCTAKCRGDCIGKLGNSKTCNQKKDGSVECTSFDKCRVRALDQTCFAKCKRNQMKNRISTGIRRGFWSWLWGKIKSGVKYVAKKVVEGAKWLGNKIKEGLKWTWNQIQKLLKLFIEVKKACLSGSLSKIAKKACVGIELKVLFLQMSELNLNFQICLDADFVRKVAEFLFGAGAKPIEQCKRRVYDLRRYMGMMAKYRDQLALAIKERRAEQVYSDDDYLEDDVIPAETETAIQESVDDHLPSIRHGDGYQRFSLLESSYNSDRTQEPGHESVEADQPEAQATSSAARRSETNLGISNEKEIQASSSCSQMKLAVRGYQTIADNLHNLVDNYMKEKESFEASKKHEVARLNQMNKNLKDDCDRMECSKADYRDAISLVTSAKEEHDKWAKAVKSQLNSQNKESVKIWRRTLNDMFMANNGYGAVQHLDNLDELSNVAAKRMTIANKENSKQQKSLDYVSKTLIDIVRKRRSLSLDDLGTKLEHLDPHLAFLQSATDSC